MSIDDRELGDRVLAELCEAGSENAFALINVVCERKGILDELANFQHALEELVRRNQISLSIGLDSANRLARLDVTESLAEIGRFRNYFTFRSSDRHWTDARRAGPPFGEPFPCVVLTMIGRKAGEQLIRTRGYNWWLTGTQ